MNIKIPKDIFSNKISSDKRMDSLLKSKKAFSNKTSSSKRMEVLLKKVNPNGLVKIN